MQGFGWDDDGKPLDQRYGQIYLWWLWFYVINFLFYNIMWCIYVGVYDQPHPYNILLFIIFQ